MIENLLSCNISPISTFIPSTENPWDSQKVRHLHNRLGFGVETSLIANALSKSPSAYIDEIIDAAISLTPTLAPAWAPLDPDDYAANGFTYSEDENATFVEETQFTFIKELIDNGVRGRLTLFWHNHFVTRVNEYDFAGYAFRYFQSLQSNCLGNFRDFVTEMGVDNAMLKFLNGFENTAVSPNENYARELYELFALGEGNGYTEDDIVETSRALTGYNEYANGENSDIIFNADNFDIEDKTIFEQTGNWGYDDVINILFAQKTELIARYICEKIYVNFVSPEVDEDVRLIIINPLADIFIANDFEIDPVLRTLFKSEHFFDYETRNTIIKSPLDFIVQFMTTTGFNFGDYELNKAMIKSNSRLFDQDILNPPTVFGWPGDRDWINSGTITFRPGFLCDEMLRWAYEEQDEEQFRQFAINVSGNSNDADVVTKAIFEALMSEVPYSLPDFEAGIETFKSSVPSNYFEDGIWTLSFPGVPQQVYELLKYLVFLPDYNLK